MRWKDLFWDQRARVHREMRIVVFGHAVLEQALKPWPGITCKAIVVPAGAEPDAAIHAWLGSLAPGASPRDLAPLPVFGFPGWSAQRRRRFMRTRYFRPRGAIKCRRESARQPLYASAEESPGSAERDAG